jgi:drug/metabolite transporter (DMT)-like permease
MIWLIFSIILSTYVGIVFKVFERFGIPNLQAIIINYFVCVVTGCIYLGFNPFTSFYFQQKYFPFAVVQGLFFFLIFHLISKCIVQNGVSATSVANKLSLVIPVIIFYFLFKENVNVLKIAGVVLAGVAVYLTSVSSTVNGTKKLNFLLPFIIFIGSGLLDSMTSIIQKKYLIASEDSSVYVIFCFSSALIFGGLFLMLQLITKRQRFNPKAIIGGILLGVPNYFSIFTFVKALEIKLMDVSALVPINNIGVVFVSTVCAVLFFKEKLNTKNIVGLAVALLAIIVILISRNY